MRVPRGGHHPEGHGRGAPQRVEPSRLQKHLSVGCFYWVKGIHWAQNATGLSIWQRLFLKTIKRNTTSPMAPPFKKFVNRRGSPLPVRKRSVEPPSLK